MFARAPIALLLLVLAALVALLKGDVNCLQAVGIPLEQDVSGAIIDHGVASQEMIVHVLGNLLNKAVDHAPHLHQVAPKSSGQVLVGCTLLELGEAHQQSVHRMNGRPFVAANIPVGFDDMLQIAPQDPELSNGEVCAGLDEVLRR